MGHTSVSWDVATCDASLHTWAAFVVVLSLATPSRWLTIPHCIGDVARIAEPHDFVTLSGLLKAFSLQLELKILAIL